MANEALTDSIAGLFDSQRFSDVTIVCEGRRLHAHKAIICTQSDFFAKACEGPFKEGHIGVIELKEENTHAVVALLGFLYNKHYQDQEVPDGTNPLTFNVRVFALAEKYFVKALQRVAAEKFKATLENKYVEDDFAEAAEEWTAITSDEDKMLGKIIAEAVMARKQSLLNPNKPNSRFRDMMNKTPWLGAEIATALAPKVLTRGRIGVFSCPGSSGFGGCSSQFTAIVENGKRYKYSCPDCRRSATFSPEGHRKGEYRYVELEQV